jgi:hypothetical protein
LYGSVNSVVEKLNREINEFETPIGKKKGSYRSLDEFVGRNAVRTGESSFLFKRQDLELVHNNLKKGKSVVYIVFPTKDGEDEIVDCLESVREDVAKESHQLLPIFTIAVNNTSDSTNERVMDFTNRHPDVQCLVYEFGSEVTASLPFVLNTLHSHRRDELETTDVSNVYFMYMDDDARVMPTESSLIWDNILKLAEEPNLKLISAQSVDDGPYKSEFHRFASASNRTAVTPLMRAKPYCHGGAGGATMRFSDFPDRGLPLDGLGGINLNAEMINLVDSQKLDSLELDEWVTRTNPQSMFFHPTRSNIFEWSCTYLGYQSAWKKGFSALPERKAEIYRRIKHRSKTDMLEVLADNYEKGVFTQEEMTGYMLIKWFYLPLLRSQNNLTQEHLKEFTRRYHDNL